MDLKVDPQRTAMIRQNMLDPTNIYVRAFREDGKVGSVDLAELDKESLEEWLVGQHKLWVVNTVGILLGHGHLIEGVGPFIVKADDAG